MLAILGVAFWSINRDNKELVISKSQMALQFFSNFFFVLLDFLYTALGFQSTIGKIIYALSIVANIFALLVLTLTLCKIAELQINY